tara:strand:- start:497 stop:718 length:222 start_codon:yes stop_codon:yes gene_type:complete
MVDAVAINRIQATAHYLRIWVVAFSPIRGELSKFLDRKLQKTPGGSPKDVHAQRALRSIAEICKGYRTGGNEL